MSWPAPTGEPIRPGAGDFGASAATDRVGNEPIVSQVPDAGATKPSSSVAHVADRTTVDDAVSVQHGDINSLAARPVTPPTLAPINERSGQPVRPWPIWTSAALMFGGAIAVSVGLLVAMWTMASPWQRVEGQVWTKVDRFNEATWLTGWFPSEPASSWRVFFAIVCCLIAVLVAASASVVGYYAFAGYRWTRIGALVALGVSLLSLLLTPIAAVSIGFVALAVAPLWLPPAKRFFVRWQLIRHPQVAYSDPVENVYYGPLPRYR